MVDSDVHRCRTPSAPSQPAAQLSQPRGGLSLFVGGSEDGKIHPTNGQPRTAPVPVAVSWPQGFSTFEMQAYFPQRYVWLRVYEWDGDRGPLPQRWRVEWLRAARQLARLWPDEYRWDPWTHRLTHVLFDELIYVLAGEEL